MRTVVFINAHSRQSNDNLKRVKRYFDHKSCPYEVIDFIVIKDLDTFDEKLKQLKSTKNLDCVIVGSGDGTIVAVMNAMKKNKNLVYGIIPLGTSNVFARSLGVPVELRRAFKLLSSQRRNDVYVGQINNKLFANSAGIGVPGEVVSNLTNKTKRYLGPLAYVVSGLREFVRHDAFTCEVKTKDGKRTFQTHHILIANGRYHGLVKVGHGASLKTNELVLIAFGTTNNKWHYVRSILTFGLLSRRRQKDTLVIHASTFKINTKPKKVIEADGEPIQKTPVTVSVHPDPLCIIS